jgi:hypothetical protein
VLNEFGSSHFKRRQALSGSGSPDGGYNTKISGVTIIILNLARGSVDNIPSRLYNICFFSIEMVSLKPYMQRRPFPKKIGDVAILIRL